MQIRMATVSTGEKEIDQQILYMDQNVKVRLYQGETRSMKTGRGNFHCSKSNIQQKEDWSPEIRLNLRKKLAKYYIWSIALSGAETCTLRKVCEKYFESFEMWYWRRMENLTWTDHVRNEEVLHRVKEKNIPHTIKRSKTNWIGHILRRNCLSRRNRNDRETRRRRKRLLDDLKEIKRTL